MTMNIDATRLIKIIKENNLRHYPVFTYIVSKVINRNDEFKMNYDEEGNLGIYDVVHPRYPIFHESDKRLSILWTEYSYDSRVFYDRFINDINTYGEIRSMAAKGKYPPNCFDMSSLPWCSFTSFDCPPTNDIVWLPPFVMVGRFFEDNGKLHKTGFFDKIQYLGGIFYIREQPNIEHINKSNPLTNSQLHSHKT